MRFRSPLRASLFVFVGWLGSVGVAGADAVTYWNNIALPAVVAGRPGPVGLLDLALIQAAVHDAVQSIEGRFEPYKVTIEGASGSPAAAAGAAAHQVLLGLYGATQAATLNAAWAAFLAANPGLVGDPGIAVGQQVATEILTLYRAAPSPAPDVRGCEDDLDGCQPGEWRPTPSYIGAPPVPAPFSPMTAPWAGALTPFTLLRSDQFRREPPPPLISGRYVQEYNEVKALGAFASTALTELARTPEQTTFAYFWSDNFLTLWHRTLRTIVETRVPSMEIGDSARLFALASLAGGDAFITAWESKLHFNFWRPVTAIQEGDFDGNPKTDGDPDWQPLINTPPYPDYTSGANNLTGATTRCLALFFGTDRFDFTVTSSASQLTDPATRTRHFTHFSQAADEVVDARIMQGIHFRSGDADGRQQGERVALWVFKHFLRPVHGNR
ncbi:MAG TPA: vanadium-dependent haloperoxidase [Vicinamibacterales bacterium]|nr:vanadium-dependent haloperoxidase [Vicinamibacterales bacterium]